VELLITTLSLKLIVVVGIGEGQRLGACLVYAQSCPAKDLASQNFG
jgi:hypothetical protein